MSAIQNYDALRQICFATRTLYEDPQFVPPQDSKIKWLRPHEITSKPKFIADGVSRFDVQQGALGDCWMVAAMANLTLNIKLFEEVVPAGQSFEPGVYCGLFRFCFWRFGRWVQVIIDDRLPVHSRKTPMYVRSSDPSEFWSGLLEKAYAKLYCSYEALAGGWMCEAMVDFTGGVAEKYDLAKSKEDIWKILRKSFERGSMIGSSIGVRQNSRIYGLFARHAYSITSLTEIRVGNLTIPLLRVRNPHGKGEWNGVWSDQSYKWLDISDSERKRIGLVVRDDGEFWISLQDWLEKFDYCEICHMTPDLIDREECQRWYSKQVEGSWEWGVSSGGHLTPTNAKQFAANPQYFVYLSDPDKDDKSGKCTLVVSLMNRNFRSAEGHDYSITKGVYIFAVSDSVSPAWRHLDGEFFRNNQPIELNPIFSMDREATSRYSLDPGIYAIVPATHDLGEEGKFLLRIWTEHEINLAESRRPNQAPDLNLLASPRPEPEVVNKPAKYDGWITLNSHVKPLRPPRRPLSARYSNEEYRLTRSDNTIYVSQRSSDQYPGKPRIVNHKNCYASSRLAAIPMRVTYPGQPLHQKKSKRGFFRALFNLKPKNQR